MVEINGDQAGNGQELTTLRRRVDSLTQELDSYDARWDRATKIWREAVVFLCGLGQDCLDPQQHKLMERFKKAVIKTTRDPDKFKDQLGKLKSSLIIANGAAAPLPVAQAAAPAQVPGQGRAARHVALAVLEALRLDDPDFNTRLEEDIFKLLGLIDQDQVRPAVALVADLLDSYRAIHQRQRRQALETLKEVLAELLSTEEELTRNLHQHQTSLGSSGRQHDDQINASVADLIRQIDAAPSLEALKGHTLRHLRLLRSAIKDRQERDREILANMEDQVGSLRTLLASTRGRLQDAEKSAQTLAQDALTDALTGVPNQRSMNAALGQALSDRQHWPLCLVVFDIDHFKGINDNFGHQAGDKALKAIAQRALQCLREYDSLFRYAGDEFVILLRRTQLEAANLVAQRVLEATQGIRFTFRGQEDIRPSVSLGVSQAQAGESAAQLFARADQALLEAKRQGRSRVVVDETVS